jgi:hypothetical protein
MEVSSHGEGGDEDGNASGGDVEGGGGDGDGGRGEGDGGGDGAGSSMIVPIDKIPVKSARELPDNVSSP